MPPAVSSSKATLLEDPSPEPRSTPRPGHDPVKSPMILHQGKVGVAHNPVNVSSCNSCYGQAVSPKRGLSGNRETKRTGFSTISGGVGWGGGGAQDNLRGWVVGWCYNPF